MSVLESIQEALGQMGLRFFVAPESPVVLVAFSPGAEGCRLIYQLYANEEGQIAAITAPDLLMVPSSNRRSVRDCINEVHVGGGVLPVKYFLDAGGALNAVTSIDVEHSANASAAIATGFGLMHQELRRSLPSLQSAACRKPRRNRLGAAVDRQLTEILANISATDGEG